MASKNFVDNLIATQDKLMDDVQGITTRDIAKLNMTFKYINKFDSFGPDSEKQVAAICLNYIKCLLYFYTNKNYICQPTFKEYLADLVLFYKNHLNIRDHIFKVISVPVLDLILDDSVPFFCVYEMVKAFNIILQVSSKSIKSTTFSEGTRIYFLKIMDFLCICGDYDCQAAVLELLYRICPDIVTYVEQLFPGNEELQQKMKSIQLPQFDYDSRFFLNEINLTNMNVYSIEADLVLIGKQKIAPPSDFKTKSLWIDFNRTSESINIQCSGDSMLKEAPVSQIDGWEMLYIHTSIIDKITLKNIPTKTVGKSKVLLDIELNNQIRVCFESSNQVARNAKSVKIILKDDDSLKKLVETCIPQIFPDKFQMVPNNIEVMKKKPYIKPLNILVSKSVARNNHLEGVMSVKSMTSALLSPTAPTDNSCIMPVNSPLYERNGMAHAGTDFYTCPDDVLPNEHSNDILRNVLLSKSLPVEMNTIQTLTGRKESEHAKTKSFGGNNILIAISDQNKIKKILTNATELISNNEAIPRRETFKIKMPLKARKNVSRVSNLDSISEDEETNYNKLPSHVDDYNSFIQNLPNNDISSPIRNTENDVTANAKHVRNTLLAKNKKISDVIEVSKSGKDEQNILIAKECPTNQTKKAINCTLNSKRLLKSKKFESNESNLLSRTNKTLTESSKNKNEGVMIDFENEIRSNILSAIKPLPQKSLQQNRVTSNNDKNTILTEEQLVDLTKLNEPKEIKRTTKKRAELQNSLDELITEFSQSIKKRPVFSQERNGENKHSGNILTAIKNGETIVKNQKFDNKLEISSQDKRGKQNILSAINLKGLKTKSIESNSESNSQKMGAIIDASKGKLKEPSDKKSKMKDSQKQPIPKIVLKKGNAVKKSISSNKGLASKIVEQPEINAPEEIINKKMTKTSKARQETDLNQNSQLSLEPATNVRRCVRQTKSKYVGKSENEDIDKPINIEKKVITTNNSNEFDESLLLLEESEKNRIHSSTVLSTDVSNNNSEIHLSLNSQKKFSQLNIAANCEMSNDFFVKDAREIGNFERGEKISNFPRFDKVPKVTILSNIILGGNTSKTHFSASEIIAEDMEPNDDIAAIPYVEENVNDKQEDIHSVDISNSNSITDSKQMKENRTNEVLEEASINETGVLNNAVKNNTSEAISISMKLSSNLEKETVGKIKSRTKITKSYIKKRKGKTVKGFGCKDINSNVHEIIDTGANTSKVIIQTENDEIKQLPMCAIPLEDVTEKQEISHLGDLNVSDSKQRTENITKKTQKDVLLDVSQYKSMEKNNDTSENIDISAVPSKNLQKEDLENLGKIKSGSKITKSSFKNPKGKTAKFDDLIAIPYDDNLIETVTEKHLGNLNDSNCISDGKEITENVKNKTHKDVLVETSQCNSMEKIIETSENTDISVKSSKNLQKENLEIVGKIKSVTKTTKSSIKKQKRKTARLDDIVAIPYVDDLIATVEKQENIHLGELKHSNCISDGKEITENITNTMQNDVFVEASQNKSIDKIIETSENIDIPTKLSKNQQENLENVANIKSKAKTTTINKRKGKKAKVKDSGCKDVKSNVHEIIDTGLKTSEPAIEIQNYENNIAIPYDDLLKTVTEKQVNSHSDGLHDSNCISDRKEITENIKNKTRKDVLMEVSQYESIKKNNETSENIDISVKSSKKLEKEKFENVSNIKSVAKTAPSIKLRKQKLSKVKGSDRTVYKIVDPCANKNQPTIGNENYKNEQHFQTFDNAIPYEEELIDTVTEKPECVHLSDVIDSTCISNCKEITENIKNKTQKEVLVEASQNESMGKINDTSEAIDISLNLSKNVQKENLENVGKIKSSAKTTRKSSTKSRKRKGREPDCTDLISSEIIKTGAKKQNRASKITNKGDMPEVKMSIASISEHEILESSNPNTLSTLENISVPSQNSQQLIIDETDPKKLNIESEEILLSSSKTAKQRKQSSNIKRTEFEEFCITSLSNKDKAGKKRKIKKEASSKSLSDLIVDKHSLFENELKPIERLDNIKETEQIATNSEYKLRLTKNIIDMINVNPAADIAVEHLNEEQSKHIPNVGSAEIADEHLKAQQPMPRRSTRCIKKKVYNFDSDVTNEDVIDDAIFDVSTEELTSPNQTTEKKVDSESNIHKNVDAPINAEKNIYKISAVSTDVTQMSIQESSLKEDAVFQNKSTDNLENNCEKENGIEENTMSKIHKNIDEPISTEKSIDEISGVSMDNVTQMSIQESSLKEDASVLQNKSIDDFQNNCDKEVSIEENTIQPNIDEPDESYITSNKSMMDLETKSISSEMSMIVAKRYTDLMKQKFDLKKSKEVLLNRLSQSECNLTSSQQEFKMFKKKGSRKLFNPHDLTYISNLNFDGNEEIEASMIDNSTQINEDTAMELTSMKATEKTLPTNHGMEIDTNKLATPIQTTNKNPKKPKTTKSMKNKSSTKKVSDIKLNETEMENKKTTEVPVKPKRKYTKKSKVAEIKTNENENLDSFDKILNTQEKLQNNKLKSRKRAASTLLKEPNNKKQKDNFAEEEFLQQNEQTSLGEDIFSNILTDIKRKNDSSLQERNMKKSITPKHKASISKEYRNKSNDSNFANIPSKDRHIFDTVYEKLHDLKSYFKHDIKKQKARYHDCKLLLDELQKIQMNHL